MLTNKVIDTVSLDKIKTFLESSSWKLITPKKDSNQYCFESKLETSKGYRIFIPYKLSEEFIKTDRYYFFMNNIIDNLSDAYHFTPQKIIELLNNYKMCRDSIMIRIVPDQDASSVTLLTLLSVMDNWTDLLAFSATSELGFLNEDGPQSYYKRVSSEGVKFSNKCRFGHTFEGSFGLRIISHFPCYTQKLLSEEDPKDRQHAPLQRRSIERIARGLFDVSEAINIKSSAPIVDNYVNAMNANMCGALEAITMEESILNLGVDFAFDTNYPLQKDVKIMATETALSASEENVCLLKAAREKMTPVSEKVTSTIQGYVTELKAKDATDFTKPRTIKIESEMQEGPRSVYVEVAPEDYAIATQANRDHDMVTISGCIIPIGRSWRLTEYNDFKLTIN